MRRILHKVCLLPKLWRDDGGALIAAEYLFVATILILGVIPGLVLVRNAMVFQMQRAACAMNTSDTCVCATIVYVDPIPCTIEASSCP